MKNGNGLPSEHRIKRKNKLEPVRISNPANSQHEEYFITKYSRTSSVEAKLTRKSIHQQNSRWRN
ncbi:CLUMA_CG000733, isoform A [Clunio marinus]|uniref:CLUMA_CG000733, isoform A n=1 Tax=Clunio marinus TaxID=568069 RepID=A0A1J1HFY8_9DIPT|nr:CLUMA_CG000733, isoform A [Clunio marinus]